MKPEWINRNIRLPDENGYTYVHLDNGRQEVRWYGRWPNDWDLCKSIKVTHWMPLFDPPIEMVSFVEELK